MVAVRAVVLCWNNRELLPRCLDHLLASEVPVGGSLEVVVVDNGSTDGSVDDLAHRYPTVDLRRTGANLGFAGGVNVGLRDLHGLDAVALVNSDAFVAPDWLGPLLQALDADPAVGAACPKILRTEPDPDGRAVIDNVGNVLGPTWELHDRGDGEVDRGQYDREEDVWGWTGGAVLLRAAYLADVGLFDERLFMYAEDVDLSWRGLHRGWRYRYVPTSVVHHVGQASSGGERSPLVDHLVRRNRLVVVTRHGGWRGAAHAWSRALGGIGLGLVTQVLGPALRRRPGDRAAWGRRVRAAWDAGLLLVGRTPPLPGREVEPPSPVS